jgi:GntR family transcriptional regulator
VDIEISARDATPVFAQIAEQVRRLVACGELVEGSELPSIRALAEQLLVNPNTVAKAYRALEAAGLVAVRRSSNTYIAATAAMAASERQAVLLKQIDALLADARQMRLPLTELVELVQSRWSETSSLDDAELSRG